MTGRPSVILRARQWASLPESWLLATLALSVAWKCWNLGHSDLTYWDESFHAIVARNLLEHPLTFTLYDQPWLEFSFKDWVNAHIWLHKPPLAMWQIAVSYLLFGVGLISLRLPSVVLSTASAFLTYRIGCAVFRNKGVGLLAAALQAFNPFLMGSIHGYYFSDHIDVALIFWIEIGLCGLVRGVQTGRIQAYLLAGVGLGAAFLTKMYPALIVAGVALALFAWKRTIPRPTSEWRIGPTQLSVMMITAIVVVLPWILYESVTHPVEFAHNIREMFGHLTIDVEQWSAPWDRFLFDYLIHQVPWLYTMVIVALGYLTMRSLRGEFGEVLVVLWAWGVLIPFSMAVSKPSSAILIALPALFLGLARLLQLAWKRDKSAALTVWAAVATAMLVLPYGESTIISRDSLPAELRTGPAPYLVANAFVLRQLGVAALVAAVLTVAERWMTAHRWSRLRTAQLAMAITVTSALAALYGAAGGDVVFQPQVAPTFRDLGQTIHAQLPENAALILDVTRPGADAVSDGYHLALMFWSNRSVYRLHFQLADRDLSDVATEIQAAGGLPLLVSDRSTIAEPALLDSGRSGFRVYPISVALAPEFNR